MSLGLVNNSLHRGCHPRFPNNLYFLQGWGCQSHCPNPQPGGPGYLFRSDLSPLTRPAWEVVLVTYVTAGMALRFI
jgi:hypothetical protein